ncbi:hypothetical protein CARUB_v10021759mg [Capsella rubella]|uniref:Uncharacterized protein n=1 Tax=Capsella rubella TaxID=81985 RepID=R0IC73_9BRAS|nr:uncharacterized protein LOC17896469 isoform X1 [Capsella rubella]EOA34248.1 hypothetical protein CARUB_v10021759mg [Capsella rubella]
MARRQVFRFQMFLVLALLYLMISWKPVLITARTEKRTDFETKGHEFSQINHLHLGRTETDPKRRTRPRRMMNVEEINDYPGSGANNRHTPHCSEC